MLSRLGERASAVPPACYDECNSALLEAQWSGKTPGICSPNSAFAALFTNCSFCASSHGDKDIELGTVAAEFQQFLNYCNSIGTDPAVASALSILSVYGYSITLSSLGPKSLTKSSTSNSLSNTSLPSLGTVTVIVTPSPTATAAPIEKASPIETASPQRPNWIAGAVIGPVFLLILAATVLYLSRKKSQRAKQMPQEGVIETKAQLHGDDIKPVGPVLLENTEVTELPANELVGSELNAV